MITALDQIGNPSSIHWAGQAARKALDDARAKVARIFNVTPGEILFTSGGTEAANLAIKGILGNRTGKSHVIASSVEHHCVLDPLRSLERSGAIEVTWLPVDKLGRIGPEEIRRAIRPATRLICMMFANNETGNIHPIAAIGRIAREAGGAPAGPPPAGGLGHTGVADSWGSGSPPAQHPELRIRRDRQ